MTLPAPFFAGLWVTPYSDIIMTSDCMGPNCPLSVNPDRPSEQYIEIHDTDESVLFFCSKGCMQAYDTKNDYPFFWNPDDTVEWSVKRDGAGWILTIDGTQWTFDHTYVNYPRVTLYEGSHDDAEVIETLNFQSDAYPKRVAKILSRCD